MNSAIDAPARVHWRTLDGIRGLAILLVLIAHIPSNQISAAQAWVKQLLNVAGYLGVDLFFVLSGFLITRILLVDRANGSSLRSFYIRRALRIFPIYYLVLGVCLLLAPSITLLWCSVYLSNYYFSLVPSDSLLRHTWSLAVEEHFYLLWPFLVMRLDPKRAPRWLMLLMGLSVASSAVLILMQVPAARSLIYSGSASRVWSLCVGAMLAYRLPNRWTSLPPTLRLFPFLTGAVVVLLGLMLGKLGSTWAFLANVIGFSLVSLGLLIAALHAHGCSGSSTKAMLSSTPLTFMGRVSYGLYLYHPFVYAVVFGSGTLDWIGFSSGWVLAPKLLLAGAAAVAVASISFYCFEIHILRLKNRWA